MRHRGGRIVDWRHPEIDVFKLAIVYHARLLADGGLSSFGFQQCRPQSYNQAVTGHFQETVRRFSGRKLKVGSGVSAHVNNIQRVIDDDRGRRILRQQHSLGCFLHIERRPDPARRRAELFGCQGVGRRELEI